MSANLSYMVNIYSKMKQWGTNNITFKVDMSINYSRVLLVMFVKYLLLSIKRVLEFQGPRASLSRS